MKLYVIWGIFFDHKEIELNINNKVTVDPWTTRIWTHHFSCSVMSNSFDSNTPGFSVHYQFPACSNSCPFSQWCHPIISSSIFHLSSYLQSFPASRSFLMSHIFSQVAKVLELQFQHQSFHWIFRTDFL